MDELIRGKMHEALDVEQPAGDLRARVLASLPVEQRPARRLQTRSFQLAGGLVAGLLAVALVAALLYSRGSLSPHPAQPGGQCAYLFSPGTSARGNMTNEVIVVINESLSACTLKAPTVSFIDASGNRLDVPQDLAPGALDGVLTLPGMGAAAVPFTIDTGHCSATSLKYANIRATFGAGIDVRVNESGEFCKGSRILVSAPIPAVSCGDGSFAWASPNTSGSKPTC